LGVIVIVSDVVEKLHQHGFILKGIYGSSLMRKNHAIQTGFMIENNLELFLLLIH
jgi:hypothetical protein